MTRLAAPPAASAVTCRWCHSTTHSIADCPAVNAAFKPDSSAGRPSAPRRQPKPKPASNRFNTIKRQPAAHSNPSRRPLMPVVRKCARCGQPVECTSNRQKYCPACKVDAQREINRNLARARRAATPRRPATIIPCARCGKAAERTANSPKHCAVCAAELRREVSREWKRARRAQQNSQ